MGRHIRNSARLISGLLALALLGNAPQGREASDQRAIIARLEDDSCRWMKEKDFAKFDAYFADEFLNVSPSGIVTPKRALNLSAFDLLDCTITTESVRFDGPVAVAIGRMAMRSKYFDGAFRFTDVFIRRNGRWQVLTSHQSPITK